MSTALPLTPLEPNTNLEQPRKRRSGGKSFDEVWNGTYFMSNIQNELTYYGKELMDSELCEAVNVSSIGNIISLNEDEEDNIIDLDEDLSERTTF